MSFTPSSRETRLLRPRFLSSQHTLHKLFHALAGEGRGVESGIGRTASVMIDASTGINGNEEPFMVEIQSLAGDSRRASKVHIGKRSLKL